MADPTTPAAALRNLIDRSLDVRDAWDQDDAYVNFDAAVSDARAALPIAEAQEEAVKAAGVVWHHFNERHHPKHMTDNLIPGGFWSPLAGMMDSEPMAALGKALDALAPQTTPEEM